MKIDELQAELDVKEAVKATAKVKDTSPECIEWHYKGYKIVNSHHTRNWWIEGGPSEGLMAWASDYDDAKEKIDGMITHKEGKKK